MGVNVAVGVGVLAWGVRVGRGVRVGLGVRVAVAVAVALAVGLGRGVDVGLAVGLAVGMGVRVAVALLSCGCSLVAVGAAAISAPPGSDTGELSGAWDVLRFCTSNSPTARRTRPSKKPPITPRPYRALFRIIGILAPYVMCKLAQD